MRMTQWKLTNGIKIEKEKSFLLVFFVIYVLSNAVFVLFNSSSLRDGMIAAILFLYFFLLIVDKKITVAIDRKYLYAVLSFFTLLFFITIINIIIYGNESIERLILSTILMMVVLITAPFFANLTNIISRKSLDGAIKFSYQFMTVLGIVSIALQEADILRAKHMIIFSEPSHFALLYLPLVFYMAYSSPAMKKIFVLAIGLLLSLVIQNLTLLVGVLFIFLLTHWGEREKLLAGIAFLVVSISIHLETFYYFIDRFEISFDSENFSVLVWLSGWERAFITFWDSFGFGLGFNRMGFVGEKGSAMMTIYEIIKEKTMRGGYLNLHDGGSLAPKIITEMGILGLILLGIYLFYFIFISKLIIKKGIISPIDIFFCGIYLIFFTQLFIRGTGYFAPSVFIFCASVYWLFIRKQERANVKIEPPNPTTA